MTTRNPMTSLKALSAGLIVFGMAGSTGIAAAPGGGNPSARYKGDFQVAEGEISPDTQYVARVRVLGAAVTTGGYDVPVTVRIHAGNDAHDGFGLYDSPTGANVNDHSFPKDYIITDQVSADSRLTIETTAWVRNKGQDGDKDSEYYEYITVSSSENSPNMIMLRDGDDVPDVKPFDGQTTIRNILDEHVNEATGKVVLYEDEVLLLFEFSKDLTSAAADFQDLILLVGLAEHESYFTYVRIPPLINFD